MKFLIKLSETNLSHVDKVGGKNASNGEMLQHLLQQGIRVPDGYATTTDAYRLFLTQNKLDKKIKQALATLNPKPSALNKISKQIRGWMMAASFPDAFEQEVKVVYSKMKNAAVAVRSSAISEDSATTSFAGAQETFLNVVGIKNVLHAIKMVYASVFTSRAIAYRHHQQLDHIDKAISVGIQPMIRSDKGASGVMFTLDTESGFDKIILINASYGLGEAIVQGLVNPDEFVVYKPLLGNVKNAILQKKLGEKAVKMVFAQARQHRRFTKIVTVNKKEREHFCLSDKDIHQLAHYALRIEAHYKKPMDIEWAKDGVTGLLYILQARPETVVSQINQEQALERYKLTKKGQVLLEGQSVGQRIGSGSAQIILDPFKQTALRPGTILVTDMTDPDWEPLMKQAVAIVTNRGGRTCHAAIIARELGIPAVVGCGLATKVIKNNMSITVSCADGQTGYVYAGNLPFKINKISVKAMPTLPVELCLNVGNPEKAFTSQFLPNKGVGLARLEFIIANIGIHPNAALMLNKLPKATQRQIITKTAAYRNPVEFYVEKLREGISTIAAAFYPKQVIFRFSDFKSNEYATLLGGAMFEPKEENPMIGFRGASRYTDERFSKAFALECDAFKRVRDDMGLTNAQLMIPFVRTVEELKQVLRLIEKNGLKRGKNKLKIYMMCEVPSNVLLAEAFLQHVDGYSVGSNDLTQLTLGLDRDSSLVAHLFDERNAAVKKLLVDVIQVCKKHKKYIGICGQAPSDYPDFAEWLMEAGMECMSLAPDSVVDVWMRLGYTLRT